MVIQGGRYALFTLASCTLYSSRLADDHVAIRCTSRSSTASFRTTRTWSVGWVSAFSKAKTYLCRRRYLRTKACWIRLGGVWSWLLVQMLAGRSVVASLVKKPILTRRHMQSVYLKQIALIQYMAQIGW